LGGHEARSGAEDRLGAGGSETGPSRELAKSRVEALSSLPLEFVPSLRWQRSQPRLESGALGAEH